MLLPSLQAVLPGMSIFFSSSKFLLLINQQIFYADVFRLLIWWVTAPSSVQALRVRRNTLEPCSKMKQPAGDDGLRGNNEDCLVSPGSTSIIDSRSNLPSGPKLAWLLRRLAQTAEDFANLDNLVEDENFELEAEDFRAEEMEIYLNEIHLRQKSMDDVWRDDIDFDVFEKR